MHIIEQNINVLCNMSYECHLMMIFKRLVIHFISNPAFVTLSLAGENGCVFFLIQWWSNINICCVFTVKHFKIGHDG